MVKILMEEYRVSQKYIYEIFAQDQLTLLDDFLIDVQIGSITEKSTDFHALVSNLRFKNKYKNKSFSYLKKNLFKLMKEEIQTKDCTR